MSNYLILTVITPIFSILIILFTKLLNKNQSINSLRFIAGLGYFSSFIFSILVLTNFNRSNSSYQGHVKYKWIPSIGASFEIGIDKVSIALFVLTSFLGLCVFVYTLSYKQSNLSTFYICLLLLQVGMLGTFISLDLLLFFACFELVLIPMYFLINIWGGENKSYSATKFFIFTMAGSGLMLLGFLSIYFASGQTFSLIEISKHHVILSSLSKNFVFLLLFIGFSIKVPLFPFHTWLPFAHTDAPTEGSVLLAGVMLKMGVYGIIRIAIPLLPCAAKTFAPYIGLLAVISIIYGAFCSWAQDDLKKLVAYSSIAHMGYVMLGVSTLTRQGIDSAIFGSIAHGLISGLLFFICGSIHHRYHTRSISVLSGMAQKLPKLSWIAIFTCIASLGMPGLAGFWGEFGSILASYNPMAGLSQPIFRTYLVIAAIGTLFAGVYMMKMISNVFYGQKSDLVEKDQKDLNIWEYLTFVPMVSLIVLFGFMPSLLTDFINSTSILGGK